MKPTAELLRNMRLRSEELRRKDDNEWNLVRTSLRGSAPDDVPGLAFDDRAWDLWFRFRGELPRGWHRDWLPVCIAHARRFSSSPWARRERAIALGRLDIAGGYYKDAVDDVDLALLRSELYLIADLVIDLGEVEL